MRGLIILLAICFSYSINAQQKPVTITQKQEGNQIVLIAKNNAEYDMKFTLNITSSGLAFDRELPVVDRVNIGEEKKVLTMTGIPGQQATFKYNLKPEALGVEEVVVSQEIKPKSFKAVVANSAKHHAAKARRNVKSKIDTLLVSIFTRIDCEECEVGLDHLKKGGEKYKEFKTSNSISNEQLMWDALYVYGKKEGKVKLPIYAVGGKIFYNIPDLDFHLENRVKE